MSTFIPPTPAATKSAEQHEEPSEQDSFNHLLYKVLRLTSEQVQDLNDWMKHRGIPNVHEIIVQNFHNPHALQDDLQFIRESKPCYIQSNVMVSLSLVTTYIKHLRYSAKAKYFGPFYYIQIDPQPHTSSTFGIQPKPSILDHSITSRLILKTMMSGVSHHLRKKYTSKHPPSLDLLPHQDRWQPQRHLNPTSPLPTSKRGLKGMLVPIPSSTMKGTTTPSFATSRQLLRHKD